jgi:hypothetical protein
VNQNDANIRKCPANTEVMKMKLLCKPLWRGVGRKGSAVS